MMKIKFYMQEDTIISAGDCSRDFYIILEGEVRVEMVDGNKLLATLNEGDYFGEANIIYNL
jgi:CRP-like cAMP-binding protein